MKILILGGYGLIGREITRMLLEEGFAVAGIRRPGRRAAMVASVEWVEADLRTMTAAPAWAPLLAGVDAVINASGALQTGGRDHVAAVQRAATRALEDACEELCLPTVVPISAPGAEPDAAHEFLSTKGAADEALRRSALNWVILKPGLVISATAYGGTSLLRMLAAFPLIQPIVLAEALVQSVGAGDVARAALRALKEPALWRREFDLVEPEARTLAETVLAFRNWLGFSPPLRLVAFPAWFGLAVARLADLAGALGWRSPLRSTALKVLADNVTGDPEPWRRATGETLESLPEVLAALPSTLQERLFARARLLFPLLAVAFSLFWIASGLIGLFGRDAAAALISGPLGETAATVFVVAGSALDMAIGVGLLFRRSFRPACLAAAALSAGYLIAGTFVTPALWADPLGPFVKVIPVIMLALVLAALAEER